MSKYQGFCDSLWVGRAKAEEGLDREAQERTLPQRAGEVVRRLCASFQCPEDQVRYVDACSGIATGPVRDSAPPLHYNPEKGRYGLDLDIGVRGRPEEGPQPVWVHLECVPLPHGGLEFHFGPALFQLPEEEGALFSQVAEAINRALRAGHAPGPRKVGF